MTLGRMTLGRMTLGRMTLGRMTLGRMTLGRMTHGRKKICRMTDFLEWSMTNYSLVCCIFLNAILPNAIMFNVWAPP
jgi:hypothetical protein